MRVLILSPHTDDGELGCGGTIARFTDEGKEVFYVALSACENSVPEPYPKDILKNEVKKATGILGINKKNLLLFDFEVREFPTNRQRILDTLLKVRKEVHPDMVIAPSTFDTHQDHCTTIREAMRAFKQCTILGYEQPWNNITFNTSVFVTLEDDHIDRKIKALECYESQMTRAYFNEEFIISLAKTRGVQVKSNFAEAFEVIKWII